MNLAQALESLRTYPDYATFVAASVANGWHLPLELTPSTLDGNDLNSYQGPVTAEEMRKALGHEPRSRNHLKPPTAFGQSKKRRGKKRPPEEEYADLIKAGVVKIVRRRGKPPEIIWLN